LFSINSGSKIGTGNGSDARKARKIVLLDKKTIDQWNARSELVMEKIAQAKYAVCPDAQRVLKATGQAELWHIILRSKHMIRFHHLERLRESMFNM
jgi:hypothetical protein